MAIKVNGLLVAGLGKSAYEQAQEGGYTGTEEEFISALANIGSNPTAEGLPVNDVRTGTVRDGQSIAAGDVVNVRALGKTVAIQWNGEPTLFRVVQVGNPDPSIYDASCDGIWMQATYKTLHRAVFGANNDYQMSNAHTWCNGDFINGFETELQEKIKTVKIPYWDGTGTEGSLKNGAEGLSTKGFFLSLDELGHPQGGAQSIGAVLSAFKSGDVGGKLGDYFICRNPGNSDDIKVFGVLTGTPDSSFAPNATQEMNFTPCFILPLDTDLSTIGTVVEDNCYVYRDVVAQKNVENVIQGSSVNGTDACYLNGQYSVVTAKNSINRDCAAYLINNLTGKSFNAITISNSADSIASVDRLDDTHFVAVFESDSVCWASVYQVTGTAITLADGARRLGDNSTNPVVVTLSTSNLAIAYNLSGKLRLTVVDYPLTSLSGKELNSVNPVNISATRIPDDGSGNKRVCICFSDTGDGNKGKAVIATIDSANAVTFGEVVTIIDDSINYTTCAATSDKIFIAAGKTRVYSYTFDLTPVSSALYGGANTTGEVLAANADKNKVVFVWSSNSLESSATVINGTAETTIKNARYAYGNTSHRSICFVADNKVLIAYANNNNSNYGTTTILEISGNQIAGSFLDNSKDAIALESGKGGDTIKLGFGGYCACEGITAGQTIDSEGITAYSPLDGWLEIKDPWARGYVTGEYTGDGTYGADNPTVIDVGFRPECLIIGAESANSATGAVFVLLNGVNLSYSLPNGGAVNVSVNESQILFYANSASGQMNASGSVYRYIAWR